MLFRSPFHTITLLRTALTVRAPPGVSLVDTPFPYPINYLYKSYHLCYSKGEMPWS